MIPAILACPFAAMGVWPTSVGGAGVCFCACGCHGFHVSERKGKDHIAVRASGACACSHRPCGCYSFHMSETLASTVANQRRCPKCTWPFKLTCTLLFNLSEMLAR
eukprot:scaffold239863_cov13-Tisochrysis_lutea.AAC.1